MFSTVNKRRKHYSVRGTVSKEYITVYEQNIIISHTHHSHSYRTTTYRWYITNHKSQTIKQPFYSISIPNTINHYFISHAIIIIMSLIYTTPASAASAGSSKKRHSIYIGGKKDAKDRNKLERWGVTHILNMTPPKDSSLQVS